jgi:serine/threonine protein kinase
LFLAIASAIKAGPQLIKFFGFDIIVFKDSLVFSMEFCDMSNYRINDYLSLLKNKLLLLHALNIVHLDIKPENVAYSPAYNEYVFIDFGLSRMIKEVRGQKTLSSFTGSLNYCSSEMLDLYVKDSLGMVDLYSNDM